MCNGMVCTLNVYFTILYYKALSSLKTVFHYCIFSDPCDVLDCHFHSNCVVVSANTVACRCHQPSSSLGNQEGCGSDGRWLDNVELIMYESCLTQKTIKPQAYEKCGKMLMLLSNYRDSIFPRPIINKLLGFWYTRA